MYAIRSYYAGPSATNLITGLADALLDSVPVVAITGQVPRDFIGTDAFQEIDVLGMSLSCTKHSFMVTDPSELGQILAEAFAIATSGRPGPVLVITSYSIHYTKLYDASRSQPALSREQRGID